MGTATAQPIQTAPPKAPWFRERVQRFRRALAVVIVVVATVVAGMTAVALFQQEKELEVGRIELSVDLFHRGVLDVYVPVVDWGARFPAVRLPARLNVDVRAIDRDVVKRVALGAPFDVEGVRKGGRDAIASYITMLLLVVLLAGLAGGALATLVVRGGSSPRKRVLGAIAAGTAVLLTVVVYATLPPRGAIDKPQYYAFGPDIPRALDAIERVRRSSRNLDQELNSQLVGLARLVVEPADRQPVADAPRLTIASDMHNNSLALPLLQRAAGGGPVLLAGDLTDRGSPLEATLVRQVVRTGRPFVFVPGNHDSDTLERQLVQDGAVVLHRDGRVNPDGSRGPVVVTVDGLRVAGYDSPALRLARDDFADRYEREPSIPDQAEFAAWLRGLIGKVDVVMVHDVNLAGAAIDELSLAPPSDPLVIVVGHSHHTSLRRLDNVAIVDGGSVGGGGTGNLGENTPIGLAELAYDANPFAPLAVDLVEIDPGDGSATARRERLDEPAPPGRGA